MLGNQNSYLTIGLVCASIFIGLIIIGLVFSVYKHWKLRKTIVISTPNQDVNNTVGGDSTKSSLNSIYDEIELYEF